MRDVLSLEDIKIIKKAEKITSTTYDLEDDNIVDTLMYVIDDLINECEKLEEAYEDLENEVEECYQLKYPTPLNEIGMRESDFI